jgi:hypothetical protein
MARDLSHPDPTLPGVPVLPRLSTHQAGFYMSLEPHNSGIDTLVLNSAPGPLATLLRGVFVTRTLHTYSMQDNSWNRHLIEKESATFGPRDGLRQRVPFSGKTETSFWS